MNGIPSRSQKGRRSAGENDLSSFSRARRPRELALNRPIPRSSLSSAASDPPARPPACKVSASAPIMRATAAWCSSSVTDEATTRSDSEFSTTNWSGWKLSLTSCCFAAFAASVSFASISLHRGRSVGMYPLTGCVASGMNWLVIRKAPTPSSPHRVTASSSAWALARTISDRYVRLASVLRVEQYLCVA